MGGGGGEAAASGRMLPLLLTASNYSQRRKKKQTACGRIFPGNIASALTSRGCENDQFAVRAEIVKFLFLGGGDSLTSAPSEMHKPVIAKMA